VFIVSALMVTLFFGSWNAPVDLPSVLIWINGWAGTDLQPLTVALDPGSLGMGLLVLVLAAPVVLTLAFAVPFYLLRSSRPGWQALLFGFLLFNVAAMGGAFTLAWIGWDWVAGLVWFMIKSFIFVFVFVWMRGTFPRVRIDHLMGFAWKWLLPAALLNLFLTASAIVVAKSL
jgi:NADH:ubiquinone oxidoreductase subunit H